MNDQRTPNIPQQPDDLRQARALARQRKRRQLMIKRTIIVLSALLIVAVVAVGIADTGRKISLLVLLIMNLLPDESLLPMALSDYMAIQNPFLSGNLPLCFFKKVFRFGL